MNRFAPGASNATMTVLSLWVALAVALAPAPGARAQPAPAAGPATAPPSADEIVRRVQAVYDRTNDYQADFTQVYTNRLMGLTGNRARRQSGRVFFQRPGRMRFDYQNPEPKLFVSNGTTLWVWEPEANQYFQQALTQSQVPTVLAFLAGRGRLAESFTARLLPIEPPDDVELRGGFVLELRPRAPSPQYDRVVFYVDGSSFLVRRALIVDPAGNTNRLDFANARTNAGIPADRFQFTPPPGARLIRP